MKLNLTHKEASLVTAILWELGQERATVTGGSPFNSPMWRITDKGVDVCQSVIEKLEDANEAANQKSGKDRDLSGAPKGTVQDAVWK